MAGRALGKEDSRLDKFFWHTITGKGAEEGNVAPF